MNPAYYFQPQPPDEYDFPFGHPNTIPAGWDLSELFKPTSNGSHPQAVDANSPLKASDTEYGNTQNPVS